VTVRVGDGYLGRREHVPFDRIIVAAAPEEIPPPLVEQLKPGGRMVIPVGEPWTGQNLLVLEKHPDGTLSRRNVLPVAFVPLTGPHTPAR
jgi:protein-L-isoaspartate(D-aspartate) O-methyltransferase